MQATPMHVHNYCTCGTNKIAFRGQMQQLRAHMRTVKATECVSKNMILYKLYLLLTAALSLGRCNGQADIFEHPQTHYALLGDSVDFHCRANGKYAYWLVNNETITAVHPDVRERYEAQGFAFNSSYSYDSSGRNRNITLMLTVLATEQTNNTLIDCRVIGPNYIHYIRSNKAYLHVFKDLRPHPPSLRVLNVSCGPQIHLSLQMQPLWPGYNISEFRLNTTNENNGMLLKQISIPLKGQTSYEYHFNETLSCVTFEHCVSSVLFTATALSPVYGESTSSRIDVALDRPLGNLSYQAITYVVFFYPNGTPFVFMEIELPSAICACQQVIYSIQVNDTTKETYKTVGPFTHIGPGVIKHNIHDVIFERNHSYVMRVHVESAGETLSSRSYFFNTTLELTTGSCISSSGTDSFALEIGVSICVAMIVTLFSSITVILVCALVYKHRGQCKSISSAARIVCHTMVPNPVYDGPPVPLYDTILPKDDTLQADVQKVIVMTEVCGHPYTDPLSSVSEAGKMKGVETEKPIQIQDIQTNALEIAMASAHKASTKGNERCSWLYFSRPFGGNVLELAPKSGNL